MYTSILFALMCIVKYSYGLTSSELASFSNGVTVDQSNATYYKMSATGLPDHGTQKVNPNDHSQQDHVVWVKKNPTFAAKTYCLPLGKIGMNSNGVTLFNPLTAQGYDAVTGANKELFDSCNGHPTDTGEYHYHQLPNCTYKSTADEFIGVALDGFAIYGPNVSDLSREITTSDLDECHGRTSTINGHSVYRYYITRQYPYILGCFKGEILADGMSGFNASYVCDKNATGCNCPLRTRGPRRPRGGAGCNMSNVILLSILAAFAAYLSQRSYH